MEPNRTTIRATSYDKKVKFILFLYKVTQMLEIIPICNSRPAVLCRSEY